MLEVLVNQFGFAIGVIIAVIGTLLYVLRTRTDTSNQVQRTNATARADVARAEATSDLRLTDAIFKLVEGMNDNNRQAATERQQTLMAIERSGGRTEGMMAAIVDSTKVIKELGIQIDEFGGRLQHIPQIKSDVTEIKGFTSSLETNLGESIGESIGEQLKPVADVLTGIERELKSLAKESQERDARNNSSLLELIALFQEAKSQFMKVIEPIVLRHITELLPGDKPSTTTTSSIEVNHKETLEEKQAP